MTGTCRQPRRWRAALSALLDGEEPAPGRDAVERHLRSCPECAVWYAEARAVSGRLRAAPDAAPDLARRVIGVVEAHICGCHTGGPCECTDCQCPDCTCGRGRTEEPIPFPP